MIIANYVLMDTPDLDGAMAAFNRVLKPGGVAVLVFSHPCFPQEIVTISEDHERIHYEWDFPYFERKKRKNTEKRSVNGVKKLNCPRRGQFEKRSPLFSDIS